MAIEAWETCGPASGTLSEDVFRKPGRLVLLGLMTFNASVWKATTIRAITIRANDIFS